MATEVTTQPTGSLEPPSPKKSSFKSSPGDNVFVTITVIFAVFIIALVFIFGFELVRQSWDAISKYGIQFFTSIDWSITDENLSFGAVNFIYASIVTAAIALIIGGTVSVGAAIFLSEYAPPWLRTPVAFTIELLAAIPSVIYGFWGVQVLSPILGGSIEPFLSNIFGFLPMFSDTVTSTTGRELPVRLTGRDILTAGVILSIMIIPIITSITRDVLRTVPDSQREGMLAMGATKWQAISKAVLPYGRTGIIGAIILGLGRAIGETVAVAYLIGGASTVIPPNPSLFVASETLPAKISNSYAEVTKDTQSPIMMLGLTLFIITFVINLIARYLVNRTNKTVVKDKESLRARIGQIAGFLFFPVVILLLSPFLSWWLALIIIGIWGLLKVNRYNEVQATTKGQKLPVPLVFLSNPNKFYRYRKGQDTTMKVLVAAAALIAMIPLASILILVTINGLPSFLSSGFLTGNQRVAPFGVLHAILGTLLMTGIGALVGIPIGVLSGIYLSEFGNNRFAGYVRLAADVLQGIPSIIIGLVAFTILIQPRFFSDPKLTSPYNGWAGGIALGIMIVPLICRNTEEILRLVPQNMREAALALGVPRWRVTVTVIIPAAFSGVMTGIILGVARIAGETAPLLYTARGNTFFPEQGLSTQTPSLTLFIFQQQKALGKEQIDLLWGAAFTLVLMIMLLTLSVRYLTRNRLGSRLSN
jgi:phosphate transport system permease protein